MKQVAFDLLAFAGFALVVCGLWLLSPALAAIVAGMVLCGIGIVGAMLWSDS